MDNQLHPSQLQGAQDVHMPTAAEPGDEGTLRFFTCLFPYCESTFPNAEDLDRHYKLVHRTPYDAPSFEGDPLANTIFSIAGEPSQPLSSFLPDANLAIEASKQGLFVGHVDYHDITSPPNLSLVDGFSINEPHTYASSIVGRNQLDTPGLLPFVPITAASTTSVSQFTSLVGGDQLNAPGLLPFVPIAVASTIFSPPTSLPTSSISSSAPPRKRQLVRPFLPTATSALHAAKRSVGRRICIDTSESTIPAHSAGIAPSRAARIPVPKGF
ncbi:hypothetical protein MMC22_006567 [Lobaria immixta]|nr:hypothetical protein [Lobaria immixta]